MAGESDEPDGAAARLEAALERIAAAAARRASAPPAHVAAQPGAKTHAVEPPPPEMEASEMGATEMAAAQMGTPVAPEIAARLDGLIERLRGALAVHPG